MKPAVWSLFFFSFTCVCTTQWSSGVEWTRVPRPQRDKIGALTNHQQCGQGLKACEYPAQQETLFFLFAMEILKKPTFMKCSAQLNGCIGIAANMPENTVEKKNPDFSLWAKKTFLPKHQTKGGKFERENKFNRFSVLLSSLLSMTLIKVLRPLWLADWLSFRFRWHSLWSWLSRFT